MLGDNLKEIRKQKGLSQEVLAGKLNVVRQTVSKWEKNLSVPDAAMLQKIAEELEVSVNEILGADINKEKETDNNLIAEQLARINEQLVIKNRRAAKVGKVIKIIVIVIAVFFVLNIPAAFLGVALYSGVKSEYSSSINMNSDNPIYSEQDINEAIDVVVSYFKKNYDGCQLKSIEYDEPDSVEAFDKIAKEYNASEAIILTSTFSTNSKGGDGNLKPNEIYRDWQWILTKSGNEEWTIQKQGY